MNKTYSYWALGVLSLLNIACAGPSTPFGPMNGWLPDSFVSHRLDHGPSHSDAIIQSSVEFKVTPDKQVLHDRSDLKISIYEPQGFSEAPSLKAYFNNYEVSDHVFSRQLLDVTPGDRQLNIEFKKLRIPAGLEKQIVFTYQRTEQSQVIRYEWESPSCTLSESMKISTIPKFRPPRAWIKSINEAANEVKINPSLLAGLVAQESSFNPKATSWAKAIGLTQITPLADKQLSSFDWKRSKKISEYPSPVIKTLIANNSLTKADDYRLNPNTSILAGAHYLDYLRVYWEQESNKQLLANIFGEMTQSDFEKVQSQILLASYNSGAYRVKKAIRAKGRDFLKDKELVEARKYVDRTTSYCYHLADKGNN